MDDRIDGMQRLNCSPSNGLPNAEPKSHLMIIALTKVQIEKNLYSRGYRLYKLDTLM